MAKNARQEWATEFDGVATALRESLKDTFIEVASACRKALDPSLAPTIETRWTKVLRQRLWPTYQYYEDYDHVGFPILYQSGISEAAKVDVLRISPTPLLPGEKPKLAGTALANFGGLFGAGVA